MIRLMLSVLCVAVMAASCVSMSQEDCAGANWRAIGANDGVDGAAYSRLETRVTQCREFGIEPDLTAYNAGYEDGLVSYCRPANGFETGRRGSGYAGVCPAEIEPEFLMAYNEGRELNRLESNLDSAERALDRTYDVIEDREDDIDELRKRQRDPETRLPEDEFHARVSDIRRDIRRLTRELDDRRRDIDRARAELRAFTWRRW